MSFLPPDTIVKEDGSSSRDDGAARAVPAVSDNRTIVANCRARINLLLQCGRRELIATACKETSSGPTPPLDLSFLLVRHY